MFILVNFLISNKICYVELLMPCAPLYYDLLKSAFFAIFISANFLITESSENNTFAVDISSYTVSNVVFHLVSAAAATGVPVQPARPLRHTHLSDLSEADADEGGLRRPHEPAPWCL